LLCSYRLFIKKKKNQTKDEFSLKYEQIGEWLGINFSGLIILDECHVFTKSLGVVSSNLSNSTQNVKLYSSLSVLSKLESIAYIDRLGLWGNAKESCFNSSIEKIDFNIQNVELDSAFVAMYNQSTEFWVLKKNI
jgi:hypothetical protein